MAIRSSTEKEKEKKLGRPIRTKHPGNKISLLFLSYLYARLCIVALVWSFYINLCIGHAKF
jgi:hypothetical protein